MKTNTVKLFLCNILCVLCISFQFQATNSAATLTLESDNTIDFITSKIHSQRTTWYTLAKDDLGFLSYNLRKRKQHGQIPEEEKANIVKKQGKQATSFLNDNAQQNNQTTSNPILIVPANATRDTDVDVCSYTVQGTELDPTTATDSDGGSLTSLTYSLQQMLPNPNLVSENFDNGSWNPANFEIGSPDGSVVNGAYNSNGTYDYDITNGSYDSRGTLRTKADFIPTVENPLYVSATLKYSSGRGLAFIGTRSTGLKNSRGGEPSNSVYFRIHNFNTGQTNIRPTDFNAKPGNSFYANPIRIAFVDNGINITGTLTNTVTNAVVSFNKDTNYSSGSWKVVFAGDSSVSWDDILISSGPHEYMQEIASGSNTLANATFGLGATTVIWTAENSAGTATSESFVVTVADNQSPTITTAANQSGQSETTVNWETTIPDAIISDACSASQLTWSMSGATTASGTGQIGTYSFAPGITTITYTVTDTSGNIATATMTVNNTKELFAAGTGTELDPYQIENWEHLFNIRFYSNNFFILNNNLDASTAGYATYASTTANLGEGWNSEYSVESIGLDGKGFTISDVYIHKSEKMYVGLFGMMINSTIQNLILKDFQIEGQIAVGALAGFVQICNVENVHVQNGQVTSQSYGGLLVGGGMGINVLNSSTRGNITGEGFLGGIVGYIEQGKIEKSNAQIEIVGLQILGGLVGGFIGGNENDYIKQSFAKGTISGSTKIGGFVGQLSDIDISNAYSEVNVTGSDNYVGGILGSGNQVNLLNTYATGKVVGVGEFVGGLTGENQTSTITDSFWNTETTEQATNVAGGTGLTTAQMKTKSTFTNANWNFTNSTGIWNIEEDANNSYPYLQNFTYDTPEASPAINPIPGFTIIRQQNTFTASGTWSDTVKWTKGTPAAGSDITIDTGVTVTLDTEDVSIYNFTLNSGATLVIPKDKEMIVNGNFATNGSLVLESDANDSGVLLINGTTTGTITYKRGGLLANKWSMISAPVSGQQIVSFAQNVDNNIRTNTNVSPIRYAIGYYDDSQPTGSKWQYYTANTPVAEEFTEGASYSMSRGTAGSVSFTGTLNVENVTKTLPTNQWAAIGNPYTTYLAANKNTNSSFLLDNFTVLDDVFRAIYTWDATQEKYIAVSEVDEENRSLAPGQGFFVRMKNGESNITFNKNKRQLKPSTGNTDFYKSTTLNATPEIVVSLSNASATVKTTIKYFDTATKGLDYGYDIGNFDAASLDVFTHLLENGNNQKFTIQSLPTKEYEEMVIPLGIKAAAGQEITFAATSKNLPEGLQVFIEDRELNVFRKLTESSKYSITTENAMNGIGRFYIHSTAQALHVQANEQLQDVKLYVHNKATLRIVGLEAGQTTIKIYSLLGKEVFCDTFETSTSEKDIALPNLGSSVFLVQLKTKNGNFTKKIVLE